MVPFVLLDKCRNRKLRYTKIIQLRTNATDEPGCPFWVQIVLISVENYQYSDIFTPVLVVKLVCLRMHDDRSECRFVVEMLIEICLDDIPYFG